MLERLKSIRKSTGLNQTQFGKRIGMSQSGYGQVETGDRPLNERLIKLICLEFNINEGWLRQGAGEMYVENKKEILAQVTNLLNLDQTEQRFLSAYLRLSPEQRENLKMSCRHIVEFYKTQDESSATIPTHPTAKDKKFSRKQASNGIKRQYGNEKEITNAAVPTGTLG